MESLLFEKPLLSSTVCIRCKRRKKKCDRTLPGCTRCSKLRVPCHYHFQINGSSIQSEPIRTSIEQAAATSQPQTRNHFHELLNPYNFSSPNASFQAVPGELSVLNLDEQLTEQFWSIINRDAIEDGILSSCSLYFKFVHVWFPIISKETLFDQILQQRSSPKGEVAILVLAIHLVSQLYSKIPRETSTLQQLYDTIKGLSGLFQSTGRSSIEMVQAGLLIAFYEHCQALHDAAYQTLGSCARMGYILGLDKTLSQDALSDPISESIAARQRQVWWGIITLERISMLDCIDKKLPFAIPSPSPSDILPSEDGTRFQVSIGLSQQGKPADPSTVELSIGARIAQGAYLLGHVIDRVSTSKPSISSCAAAHVDLTLRSYAMELLKPAGHGHLCWPYAICLSAILVLNRFEITVEPEPSEAHEKENFQSRAALGLKSALRMMLDSMMSASKGAEANLVAIPIWALHRAQYAAVLSLDFGVVDDDLELWMSYIETVKRMLGAIEARSNLAGNYLKAILDAEERRTQVLACHAHC
ncbi:hypothetical protein ONS95_010638 [Cadophora gregata]|uniref:uncharacterized protein n=1 Tax=Cadophora gregata TaxID=51156 RepID=UPI0026DB2D6B|nr:uncharacterized protein ONS95_010638 [Cadophora gregata]KAK0122398.1 hypothetical protein ONS95_010638 [Cadophora gregata]KAK0127878.1 hypothetical protein ONS96_007378 [Cadophora gregata f. sp. sojae]